MSAVAQSVLRIVTFGSASTTWGAAWESATQHLMLRGESQEEQRTEFALDGVEAEKAWRLSSEGVSLEMVPHADAVEHPELGGFDQLCRIEGEVTNGDGRRSFAELGRRCTRTPPPLDQFESIRDFSAWFEPADGAALTALRPVDASGHDADLVGAALFECGSAMSVAEPRLSTTYASDGVPTRVGLELWVAQAHDEEENLYPRRFAGEADGAPISSSDGPLELLARPFRCLSHGQEGSGLYLLARSR